VGLIYNEDEKGAGELARTIEEDGGSTHLLCADVSDLGRMMEVTGRYAESSPPGLDGIVVNAGIYRRKAFSELDQEDWVRTHEVNLTGAFNTMKASLPHMDRGSIVMVSSQLAFRGSLNGADYASSKAGLLGLGRSLAIELAPSIRVNMIAPGFVDTAILAQHSPVKRRERESQVPLQRIGSPSEIAGAILFLLSDLSSYVTGATLDVNGGLYIR